MQDPTRDEMLAFLASQPGADDELEREFDTEAAIYWFAYDYHGGQSSNLYSALSSSEYHPGPLCRDAAHEGEFCAMLHEALETEFGGSRDEASAAWKAEALRRSLRAHRHRGTTAARSIFPWLRIRNRAGRPCIPQDRRFLKR